jgi:hypothetical protein
MKAILSFNLPEDKVDFKIAAAAGELYSALIEIQELARRYRKYIDDEKIDKDVILEELYACLEVLNNIE